MVEWKLSFKAGALMSQMANLSSWATPITSESGVYYTLYRQKIKEELPVLGLNNETISKYIQELETKNLIESINKNTIPSYRLSAKGKEWVSSTLKSNGGEKCDKEESEISPVKKEEKVTAFTFTLSRNKSFDNLPQEYKEKLKMACHTYAGEEGIPTVEYETFADWHSAKGSEFKNWGSAFKNWCKKYTKYTKTNEVDPYFSNNGKGLWS